MTIQIDCRIVHSIETGWQTPTESTPTVKRLSRQPDKSYEQQALTSSKL
ncbi:hypothetical protein [Klebsiella phage vB_KpnP_cmc355D]|uniref:Uncharacterized protein n=1 Tax=Klebsiella phage vB_KpnP_cmc355D TaxID=3110534 RepID=A0ABZ0ZZI2_9CAUD|nr:hypothetical protein [Klebsiella phage vB_KpnP_cmc355D]